MAVIGDVHGRADLLARLLRLLPADMPVLTVGDMCDRGPDSRGVIELLVQRGERTGGAFGIRGNHEEWLIQLATGGGFETAALSPAMGGRETLASYGFEGVAPAAIEAQVWRIPGSHAAFLASLPVALDLTVCGDKYWLVHAGVSATTSAPVRSLAEVVPWLAQNRAANLLWPHTEPEDTLPLDRTVIMGHLPRRRPLDAGHVIAIDTGCGRYHDGHLTAVILPSRRFLS